MGNNTLQKPTDLQIIESFRKKSMRYTCHITGLFMERNEMLLKTDKEFLSNLWDFGKNENNLLKFIDTHLDYSWDWKKLGAELPITFIEKYVKMEHLSRNENFMQGISHRTDLSLNFIIKHRNQLTMTYQIHKILKKAVEENEQKMTIEEILQKYFLLSKIGEKDE